MDDKQPLIPEEERIVRMWEPLSFDVDEDYDYAYNKWYQQFWSAVFRMVATVILWGFDTVVLGMRADGRKNLRALKGSGAVAICNHIHAMDCTLVDWALAFHRVRYVTLEVNFRIPLVRHIIRWLGAVPLTRSPKQIRKLFDEMGKQIQKGAIVQIYPEGVLNPYDTTLRNFHNGAFRVAVDNGVPVVPMVITQHPPRGLYRLYKRKPCLHIHVLEPVFPNPELSRRESIADMRHRCRDAMEQALKSG